MLDVKQQTYLQKRTQTYIGTLSKSEHVSEKNRETIEKFVNECYAQGLGHRRVRKLLTCLHRILKTAGKDFDLLAAEKEDLKKLVVLIEQSVKDDGEPCSPWYKANMKGAVKKFYKTMQPTEDNECPSKARWIPSRMKWVDEELPEPLSREEVDKMIDAAQNDRMRCMLMVLYEGGIRAGELLALRVRDVEFVENGIKLNVRGKTGNRKILLVESERFLKDWLSKHPFRENRDAPLWVMVGNRKRENAEDARIGYNTFRVLFKREATRAGIRLRHQNGHSKSEVHPHIFRHSRATHLAPRLSEAVMKEFFGWRQNSDVPARYIHLSGRDVDNEILKLHGIKTETNSEETKECPRCFRLNRGADFCSRCAMPLTWDAARKKEEAQGEIQAILRLLVDNGITLEEFGKVLNGVPR